MRRDVRLRKLANEAKYAPVESVPDGLTWKPGRGSGNARFTVLFSMGNIYKLVRSRETGEVSYFMLQDTGPEKSPAEKIDAEPAEPKQVRYRKGATCWFVDTNGCWYLVEVVDRVGMSRATYGEPGRITIRSVTGWDADKRAPWGYGELLEFPAKPTNAIFRRLRPLKARYT